jgi:hypothetical protein
MPRRKLYTVSTSEGSGWEATESGAAVIEPGDRDPEVVRAAARVARQRVLGVTSHPSDETERSRRSGRIHSGPSGDRRRDGAMETHFPEGDRLPDPQGPDEVPPQEPTEEGLPDGEEYAPAPAPDPESLGEWMFESSIRG